MTFFLSLIPFVTVSCLKLHLQKKKIVWRRIILCSSPHGSWGSVWPNLVFEFFWPCQSSWYLWNYWHQRRSRRLNTYSLVRRVRVGHALYILSAVCVCIMWRLLCHHKSGSKADRVSPPSDSGGCPEKHKRGQEESGNVYVYYESIKREPKIRGIYECRCDERLQTKTKKFTLLPYTGLVLELEHLKIETRLIDEKFASVRGECEI